MVGEAPKGVQWVGREGQEVPSFQRQLGVHTRAQQQPEQHLQTWVEQVSDMTNEEYRVMYFGTKSDAKRRLMKTKSTGHRYAYSAGDQLPVHVDWRVKGAVAPIKDQGSCGEFFFLSFCLFLW